VGVYTRPDSPVYWLLLEGFVTPSGRTRRERTKIRVDARLSAQRRHNRELAEQAFHARMAALARQELQPTTKPPITFDAFAAWFAEHKLPKRRGHEREAEILRAAAGGVRALPLRAVDRQRVEEYATMRLTTPTLVRKKKRTAPRRVRAGPSTVNREIDLVKAILQAAVPKYLEASPLYGMKRLPTTPPQRRLLTLAEEHRLLAVLAPDDKALFLLGEDSLVRLSDLLDLKWTDHGTAIGCGLPIRRRAAGSRCRSRSARVSR
jgi:hypothetical protein